MTVTGSRYCDTLVVCLIHPDVCRFTLMYAHIILHEIKVKRILMLEFVGNL